MIGIDLTNIERFKDVNDKFITKVLHPEEIAEYKISDDKIKYIATRWAIKEALFKSDNSMFSFSETRIIKKDKKYILEGYNISTSNEDNYIIAVVEKEKKCQK